MLFKNAPKPTIIATTVLLALFAFGEGAFARKVCDDGTYAPCNTGGEPPETEGGGNNLSRPTIIMPGGGLTNVLCETNMVWPAIVSPTGEPQNEFSIDKTLYWFVQGDAKWQAPCATWDILPTPVPVFGSWGDNLSGDAKLKVGSPIRVELVLSYNPENEVLVDGYVVEKLQPELLDRISAYGTLATNDGNDVFNATPSDFIPGVYDSEAWLTIEGSDYEVNEAATAEINAKGIVVYGYNLRVPSAGDYTITYTIPNVNFMGSDAGICEGNTCELVITVGSGGGGGGGGKGKTR